jgi:tetratricopeptide (TPR) repeat protein
MKLGPGVRLNASKTGLGVSAGPRGARVSKHTSGRTTKSVGVPGSGVSYVKTSGGGSSRSKSGAVPPHPPPPSAIPKAGLFAPAYEKAFAKGVSDYVSGDAANALRQFQDAAHKDTGNKSIADDFFAGIICVQLGKFDEAAPYLERVVSSPVELPDQLMAKYVLGGDTTIAVTPRVSVKVPFGSTAATLALAEVYQAAGRKSEAIGILHQLVQVRPEPALLLSLAELLAEEKAWDELVDLTAGTKNVDDVTLATCILQAKALEEQGMEEAALEVYRDALRARKRDAELLKEARYGRGRLYLKLGKKAQGKKDLGRVYADDPNYPGVSEFLQDD